MSMIEAYKAIEQKDVTALSGALARFTGQESIVVGKPPWFIPVGPHGEPARYQGKPPKNRPLAIGIGNDGFLVISYPKGDSRIQGDHAVPEHTVLRALNGSIAVLFTGSVEPIAQPDGSTNHIIYVYAMHPADIDQMGGVRDLLVDLNRSGRGFERGKVVPEKHMDNITAQRLLAALGADELQIVYALPSAQIYSRTR